MAAGGYELLKSGDDSEVQSPKSYRTIRRIVIGLVACLALVTLSFLHIHHPLSVDLGAQDNHDGDSVKACASPAPPAARPPAPINPWASLTIEQTVQIQKWLEQPAQALNLTRGAISKPSDNHIFMIEAYYPPKASVLRYFSSLSLSDIPEKYARVTIHHGSALEPVIKDYLVGPLPIGSSTRMEHLTEIYHLDAIPHNARGFDTRDWTTPEIFEKMAAPLMEAYKELLGGTPQDTLTTAGSGPFSFDGSFRRLWLSWRRNTPGYFLHPLNLYQYVDLSGTDPSQWDQLKIVYNHQVFNSPESFMEAFHNGSLKRIPVIDPDIDLSYSTRKRIGAQRDLDYLPGPRSVSFAGLRFRVDRNLQYVSWMGWGLYLGFDRDMGLSLWDINFRGERIVYELKPQEALAQYAGNDPFQATTAWLDRYFGMGQSVRDMLPGYDCPHEAVYLPATTYSVNGLTTQQRAICIFEHDSGRPLTRHLGYEENEFGAVKGYELVIRSIATVGNYDYCTCSFDYIFHLDGTIEVRVSASGYLQAGFYDETQGQYGSRIWETSMGSLHDHVINYKVDLDVAGTANSLLKTTLSQESITQPWFEDDWGDEVIQQVVTREYIDDENNALLKFPTNFQGGYAIVNQEETNKWGTSRGYAIHPGYSPIHNTVVGSKRLMQNANWARYNLAISRRKETEPSSSSMWNFNLPGGPPVDFHKFFDGENITQEDLVAWVNLGMHHLPQSEDAPNTRTNTATSSFFLTPLNYFDHDVSIESTNAVLLKNPEKPGDPFTYNDYGVQPAHCLPEHPSPFEYHPAKMFDLDGRPAPASSIEDMRKASELYHRIKLEL